MTDVAEFTNEVKRDSETLLIIRQIEVCVNLEHVLVQTTLGISFPKSFHYPFTFS